MTTILITAIGGDISQSIAQIVRIVRPNWRIIGVDIHDQHGGALVADIVKTVPPATSPNYLESMEQIVERYDVQHCFPMSEAELAVLHRDGINAFGQAHLVKANARAIEIGLDKLATAQFLTEAGCPSPWTISADVGVEPPNFPCIFKLRRSAGSKGVYVCRDSSEAVYLTRRYPQAIFQELLEPADKEVTCAIYRTLDGRTAVLSLLRRLAGGFTGWARVIDEPEVVDQCVQLAEALNLRGAINAQLRITAAGPRIFEINPRISSTVLIRHILGFTDFEWMLNELDGISPVFRKVPVGQVAVRVQGAKIIS